MPASVLIFLAIGTVLMLIPMLLTAWKYKIEYWKVAIISVLLTITGTLGTYIWHFVENGYFGGRSFFGAVFIVPIVFAVLPFIFKISYKGLMDMCASAECIMLALMKAKCMIDGCCSGRLIYITTESKGVYFPSQLAELIAAIVIGFVLLRYALKKQYFGMIYPLYLVFYGMSRFMLNLYRAEWDVFQGSIPYGNIWSVVSIIIGCIWIKVLLKKSRRSCETKNNENA